MLETVAFTRDSLFLNFKVHFRSTTIKLHSLLVELKNVCVVVKISKMTNFSIFFYHFMSQIYFKCELLRNFIKKS